MGNVCEYCGDDTYYCGHIECPSCEGNGEYVLGDCEDGIYIECPECEGNGYVNG